MANIKSRKKRIKTNEKKHLLNKSKKSATKTAVKKAIIAKQKQQENAVELQNKAESLIDKSAQKGIIHKNKAARWKSRLNKKISKI